MRRCVMQVLSVEDFGAERLLLKGRVGGRVGYEGGGGDEDKSGGGVGDEGGGGNGENSGGGVGDEGRGGVDSGGGSRDVEAGDWIAGSSSA